MSTETKPNAQGAASDHRKTARFVDDLPHFPAGAIRIGNFSAARAIMRSGNSRQGGFDIDNVMRRQKGRNMSIIYQDGEEHRRQRSVTARFFAPKVVSTRYRATMEQESDRLVDEIKHRGKVELGDISMRLAVAVASEIVGLTESDPKAMARHLSAFFEPISKPGGGRLKLLLKKAVFTWKITAFHRTHVRPAIAARRTHPREDLISHLIGEGYSPAEILTECMSYAAAGMVTTREFIVMAVWHLHDNEEVKQRFLQEDEVGKIAILEEILRLDPVVARLYRRIDDAIELPEAEGGAIPAGSTVEFDIRAINSDPAVAGACPYSFDIDRGIPAKNGNALFSFGDGPHRCPGAGVAMVESAVFLDRLLRLPGLALVRDPDVSWVRLVCSYELAGAQVACKQQ